METQKQPHFEIVTAAGRRQLVLRDEPLTIGRHAENRLVLQDDMASRFHCVIERTTGGYFLRDLGASNGTLVNGRRVKSALLTPGDVVTIGRTSLVLIMPDKPGLLGNNNDPEQAAAALKGGPPIKRVPQAKHRGFVKGPLTEPNPLDDEPIPLDDPIPLDALDELAKPAPGTEIEELSELDVVGDDDLADGGGGWGGKSGGGDDERIHVEHEEERTEDAAMDSLRLMAEQIPNKPFS
jgi:predicted component of type VI protein secretion system